jgi:hypothetical protein
VAVRAFIKLQTVAYGGVAMVLCACATTVGGEPEVGSGSNGMNESSGGSGGTAPSGGSAAGGTTSTGTGASSGGTGSSTGSASGASGSAPNPFAGGSATGIYFGNTGGSSSESGSGGTSGDAGAQESGSQGSGGLDAGGTAVMHRDAAVPVLTGCAAQVPTAVFAASCEGNACHNSKDKEYALDLQSPGVVSRLLNVPSLEVPRLKLIDPNVPAQSFILLKVALAMPPAGMQMPQMGAKLSAAETQCFQQWVETVATGPY